MERFVMPIDKAALKRFLLIQKAKRVSSKCHDPISKNVSVFSVHCSCRERICLTRKEYLSTETTFLSLKFYVIRKLYVSYMCMVNERVAIPLRRLFGMVNHIVSLQNNKINWKLNDSSSFDDTCNILCMWDMLILT